ncbi:unnamed protein product [Ectocarpus sp. 8 AP-2014]
MESAENLAEINQVASNRVADALAAESSRLSLARIGIDALPGDLTASNRVTHITVLDLKHNALQILPSELFLCVTQLEEVDASKNRISYLPETIGLATGLRKLNLQGNCLRDIPNGLCLLQVLETLDLAQNMLESLPKEIGGLKKLRRLDLANNRLEEIPDEVSLLEELEHVGLQGNPIQRMPLAVERLQTKGELLRSKARRQKLVSRALHVRGSVRAAFANECFEDRTLVSPS